MTPNDRSAAERLREAVALIERGRFLAKTPGQRSGADAWLVQALKRLAEVETALDASDASVPEPPDISDRDKTVENLIIALAYRYDDSKEGTPCFCVSGDAVDGEGRITVHTPRCRLARIVLDKWRHGVPEPPTEADEERCAECGGVRCPTCGQGCIDALEAHPAAQESTDD